ncbi:unnamed protein product [Scytosiphon promiscuus]
MRMPRSTLGAMLHVEVQGVAGGLPHFEIAIYFLVCTFFRKTTFTHQPVDSARVLMFPCFQRKKRAGRAGSGCLMMSPVLACVFARARASTATLVLCFLISVRLAFVL